MRLNLEDMEDDKTSYLRSRCHAPMVWVLLPILMGFVCGRYFGGWVEVVFILGILGAIFSLFLVLRGGRATNTARVVGFLSILLLGYAYFVYKKTDFKEDFVPREGNFEMKIERPYSVKDKYGRQGGVAEIIGASEHLVKFLGQKVYYFLKVPDGEYTLTKTQVVSVKGVISKIDTEADSKFDKYLINQGISIVIKRGRITNTIKEAKATELFFKEQNERLEEILRRELVQSEEVLKNIYLGMLLGKKNYLDLKHKRAFQRTGSLHLFAISGLHVGVIAAAIAFILHFLRIPSTYSAMIGLTGLYLYVKVTGSSPSAMRAFMMVAFYWGARVFYRKKSGFSALLGSALVMLMINPYDLWNPGFQLSYCVVGAILLFAGPLVEIMNSWMVENWIKRKRWVYSYKLHNFFRWGLTMVIVSLAANLASLPLCIYYFDIFTPGGILLSLVLIPIASVAIILGFVSILVGLVGGGIISGVVNWCATTIIQGMIFIIGGSLKIKGLFWPMSFSSYIVPLLVISLLFGWLLWGHERNLLERRLFYMLPGLLLGGSLIGQLLFG